MAKSFKELRESVVKTADKKPEKFTKPDGKVGIRMVPVDKQIVKNEEKVDEVLDTPKTYNSYKRKAQRSARNAHNDRTFGRRTPEDNKRNDKTMAKRDKGLAMADRARNRTFNKQTGQGYVNKPIGESFDHSVHQDHAFAHYDAATEHEHSGNHEAAAHHYKASDHHDEAHAAHERGDHTVGAYHAKKAAEHASKAAQAAMKHGGEHKDISHHAYRDSKDTHDATPQSSGHSAASASKLTRESTQVDELSMTAIKKGVTQGSGMKNVAKAMDKDKLKKDLEDMKAKMATEAYDEPQGQAKRMMSPLQKARMDKEKADRDSSGKLKPRASRRGRSTMSRLNDIQNKANAMAYATMKKKPRKEEVEQVDEVLDRPGALASYKKKAKMQSDKARNSATAKIVRGNPDISKEKETIRKREKGQDMADRTGARQFRKSIGRPYIKKEEVDLDEGILKPYHAAAKQPWSKTVKDSKGTAGEHKQISKGKDFTVWTAYRGSNKSQPHYVVRDDKVIGSGMTHNSALKDAGLKDKDVTHRSKFAAGSILNKGMKEEYVNEKLKVSDGMGAWVDDFKKSDAPQFKGKSDKERREMAIAAYLSAKRGDKR